MGNWLTSMFRSKKTALRREERSDLAAIKHIAVAKAEVAVEETRSTRANLTEAIEALQNRRRGRND